MELTVIRMEDRRRMVVTVDAGDQAEALRTIEKAVGPVTVARALPLVQRRGGGAGVRRHARAATYF